MKKSNLTIRLMGVVAALDAVLVFSSGLAFLPIVGVDVGPLAAGSALVLTLRLIGYWWLLNQLVEPTVDLHRRVDYTRGIGEAELLLADARLQNAPGRISLFSSFVWALSPPVLLGIQYLLVGLPETRTLLLPIIGSLCAVGFFGPIAILVPLVGWMTSAASGRNYLLAVERGVELERPRRPVAFRIGVLGLCLIAVPFGLVVAAGLSAQSAADYTVTHQRAAVLAEALRYHAEEAAASDAFAAVESQYDTEQSTLFVLEAGAEARWGGSRAPDWATPEFLATVAGDAVKPPDRAASVVALRLGDGRTVGAVVTGGGVKSGFFTLSLIASPNLILFGLVAVWLMTRSISVPLQQIAELARCAAREGALSQLADLPVSQLDEVGVATINLNELFDGLRSLAVDASVVGDGKLAAEISGNGELPEAFRRMAQQLRNVVEEVHSTSAELASAAAEISAASQEQEAATTSHSTGMTEISRTMDSLSESAAHVASAVGGVLDNAERTLQNTDQMVARINDLTGHANRIGDILDVIREIADRTDLLALNGSLEATRAGEAGVGFSLVASEMRRLAERVTASVSDIKSLVSDIRESGASTVVATEESKKLADATTRAARNITLVTQQQQSSTEQVSQNVRAAVDVVRQAAAATSLVRESATGLKLQADRLSELVRQFQLAQ